MTRTAPSTEEKAAPGKSSTGKKEHRGRECKGKMNTEEKEHRGKGVQGKRV